MKRRATQFMVQLEGDQSSQGVARERKARGIKSGTMAVKPWVPPSVMRNLPRHPAIAAGLRGKHVITAVNGISPDIYGRAFMVWFRLQFEAGDEITLTVVNRQGKKAEIKYQTLQGKH